MHIRPMRFSIVCTPTDSSGKIQFMYSTTFLCLFVSEYDINASRLNEQQIIATSILICKSSARIKQRVISVAFKTPLETRLAICVYKTSHLHGFDDYIGFTPSCTPHILQHCASGCNNQWRN